MTTLIQSRLLCRESTTRGAQLSSIDFKKNNVLKAPFSSRKVGDVMMRRRRKLSPLLESKMSLLKKAIMNP